MVQVKVLVFKRFAIKSTSGETEDTDRGGPAHGKNSEVPNVPRVPCCCSELGQRSAEKPSVYTLQLSLCFMTEHTRTSVSCNVIFAGGVYPGLFS